MQLELINSQSLTPGNEKIVNYLKKLAETSFEKASEELVKLTLDDIQRIPFE